jgi:hypothetical protein
MVVRMSFSCVLLGQKEAVKSEKHGNPKYLGEEPYFTIGTQKELLN